MGYGRYTVVNNLTVVLLGRDYCSLSAALVARAEPAVNDALPGEGLRRGPLLVQQVGRLL